MVDSFCHLHVHTSYSLLDGAAKIEELVKKIASDKQPACGITDHGVMYGIPDFVKTCKQYNTKPIPGIEFYFVDDRFSTPKKTKVEDDTGGESSDGRKNYYHLLALAENNTGYHNIIKLSTKAFLEGYHQKPRIDWQLLDEYHEGIIATSGCLGGMVLQSLLRGDYQEAISIASRYKDIFGKDNFFIELQDHGIREQNQTNPSLIKIADQLDLGLVLTNDSHYTNREDHHTHDGLLCTQTGSTLSTKNRFRFEGEEHYVKTAAEMRRLFPDFKEACDNTLLIAERANVDIEDPGYKLPKFPVSSEYKSSYEYLQHLVYQGARKRWGNEELKKNTDRLLYELSTIESMGFSDYFLIVWDLCRYAKERGAMVGPGRGSVGGVAVAYCLGITEIDAIKYDLLFERFLNPERVSNPDIDLDIEPRFRNEWIEYAKSKYGDDRVAQIITYSQIKARAAVRDAARVLDMPYTFGDKIVKTMPPLVMGKDTPLKACLELDIKYKDGYARATDFRMLYSKDEDAKKVVDLALGLENLHRQDGIHAAAVVISDRPLIDVLPLQQKTDTPVVTQYNMHTVEDLGLVKMDFLGLRNLEVISDTVKRIGIDINNIPLDDKKTYEILREGKTLGLFQVESDGCQALLRRLKPTSFHDIAAMVALYRPGPMSANMHNDYADRKNGLKEIEYLHEDAEDILGPTYGLMIYQEQIMKIAQKFAGFSLSEADNLRKVVGKKKPELMPAEEKKFIEGCIKTGYGIDLGKAWFKLIGPFADYGFSESHGVAYGLICYQTAYLKANYTAEYMASLLSSESDNHDKLRIYLGECRRLGIAIRTPDVNQSTADFGVIDDKNITYGMTSIRNAGEGTAQSIAQQRIKNGKYKDFYDFAARSSNAVLNKKVVESLIKAGAFDLMGYPRKGLLESYDKITTRITTERKKQEKGQYDLFSTGEIQADCHIEIPDVEFPMEEKLAIEKEMLGLYISSHPLDKIEQELKQKTRMTIDQLTLEDQSSVYIGGLVTNLNVKRTKKGDIMALFMLEDLYGSINVIAFPKAYKSYGHLLDNDVILLIDGKIDTREDLPKVIVNSMEEFELPKQTVDPLHLWFNTIEKNKLEELKNIFKDHSGDVAIFMHTKDSVVKLQETINLDDKLLHDVRLVLSK